MTRTSTGSLDTTTAISVLTLAVTTLVGLIFFVVSIRRSRLVLSRAGVGAVVLSAMGAGIFVFASLVQWLAFLAAAPVFLFAVAVLWHLPAKNEKDRRAAVLAFLATVAWVATATFQFAMAEWSLTVSGPIRVDILVTPPMLALCSGIAVSALCAKRQDP